MIKENLNKLNQRWNKAYSISFIWFLVIWIPIGIAACFAGRAIDTYCSRQTQIWIAVASVIILASLSVYIYRQKNKNRKKHLCNANQGSL